jgi:hypothetical protein
VIASTSLEVDHCLGIAAHVACVESFDQLDSNTVTLRGARFGFLGHPYPGMLDMYTDLPQISALRTVGVS